MISVRVELDSLNGATARHSDRPCVFTYLAETKLTELDGEIIQSIYCVETLKHYPAPPYLTANDFERWVQSTVGSETKVSTFSPSYMD